MRASAPLVALAAIVVACNALNGAGDLEVCADCDGGAPGGGSSGASGSSGSSGASGSSSGAIDAGGDVGLPPTCNDGDKACAGRVAATCVSNAWQTTTCAQSCLDGACVPYPSCRATSPSCGPAGASCCATGAVAGGTFQRKNNSSLVATVSSFELDLFEVTVRRFRAFVDAGGATQASPPAAGAGAHPKIPNSGWNAAWNTYLPADVATLKSTLGAGSYATWTAAPGANEDKPIDDVSYLEAFAFCAWDGGRLPTLAELSYAQTGGAEQRVYPWSVPPSSTSISTARAIYDCAYAPPSYSCRTSCSDGTTPSPCDTTTCIAPAVCQTSCGGCSPNDIAIVGQAPTGAGKWGQLDLAGSMGELVLDVAFVPPSTVAPPVPCVDCAALPPAVLSGVGGKKGASVDIVVLGGAWNDPSTTSLRAASAGSQSFDATSDDVGFRCAR